MSGEIKVGGYAARRHPVPLPKAEGDSARLAYQILDALRLVSTSRAGFFADATRCAHQYQLPIFNRRVLDGEMTGQISEAFGLRALADREARSEERRVGKEWRCRG